LTKQKNSMAIILTLSLATLLGTMNMTIFNVAMPALMVYFQTDVTTIQWLSSGFMLAAGVITPTVGFLGAKLGYKRSLLAATFCVLVLAFVGMFSWCIEVLIVVRILFGLVAGTLMPLSMAMIYQTVPRQNQAQAAAIWGTANMLGGAMPAVLSGLIITYGRWQYLLLIMVPLALLLLISTWRVLPNDQKQDNMKLDLFGISITSLGSFVLLFAFSNLSAWGFSGKFAVLTLIGLLCLAVYVKRSWGKDDVMLNLSVLKYPRYVAALLADAMNIIALYMMTFVMPLFLQNGLGLSAATTGLIMLPCVFFSAAAMPIATKVLNGKGEKALAITGIVIIVIGSIPFFKMDITIPILLVLAGMCIRNFGIGFMNLLTTNTSMAAVPKELSGYASSLTNWVRQMVGALVTSLSSNIVGFRIAMSQAQTPEAISSVYISSTSLLTIVSCTTFMLIIPLAIKYFRGKDEMKNEV